MLQEVTRQLETVRSRSRLLIVVRRLAQATAVFVFVFLGLGLIDWLLRLPGVLRLLLGLGLVGTGGWWLIQRLRAGLSFAPSLESLAQRAEGLYPELAGTLASAVAFATQAPSLETVGTRDLSSSSSPDSTRNTRESGLESDSGSWRPASAPRTTQALAEATMRSAEAKASNFDLKRVLDPRATTRALGGLALALVLLTVVVAAAPTWAGTAWQRWAMPLGSTVWPNRVMLELEALPDAVPSDSALPVVAKLTRGDRPGRRVVLETQWRGDQGAETPSAMGAVVMESIGEGRYRFVIDAFALPDEHEQTLRLWARSHDGRTSSHDVRVVIPPRVTSISGTLSPPDYAADLIQPEPLDGLMRGGQVQARVLKGGSIAAAFGLNQLLSEGIETAQLIRSDRDRTPGPEATSESRPEDDARWQVTRSDRALMLETPVRNAFDVRPQVVSRDGIELRDPPTLSVLAIVDEPPEVSLDPLTTTVVVPDAVIELVGRARDDVGLAWIQLEAYRRSSEASEVEDVSQATAARLGEALEDRRPDLQLERTLDLATLDLRPGDRVQVVARAQDVFDLDGVQHDAVTARRMLSIIDPVEAERRLSDELAQLRNMIQPAERRQRETNATLAALPDEVTAGEAAMAAERAAEPQERVVEQLERVAEALEQLERRAETNRLDQGSFGERLNQATEGLNQAQSAAEAAQRALSEATPEAGDANPPTESARESAIEATRDAEAAGNEAAEAMRALMAMLDANRASAEMNAQLRQMLGQQQALSEANDAMRAQTAGRSSDQLSSQERAALDELARQQAELGEQARDLADRLDEAADALEQDPNDPAEAASAADQAAADALRQAAETAREQQPESAMQRAAEQMQQNQMAEASAQQAAAAQALQAMLAPMEQVQQRQQERLDALTRELAERLQRLADQQDQEIQDLAATPVTAPLTTREESQTQLRRRTIDARQQAESSAETQEVATLVGTAVEAQAQAVRRLRDEQRAAADEAERAALARLNEAIDQLAELQAQREQQAAQRERAALRSAYQALADRQALVRSVVEPLAAQERLSRRDRPAVIQQSQSQSALVTDAQALAEKVAATIVFRRLHDTIDQAGQRAAQALATAQIDATTTADLARVERALRRAAEALADPPPDDPFDDGSGSAESGGGGGGTGDSGGAAPEAVPPLAELRLLRGWQEDVMLETRMAAEMPEETRGTFAERLSEDQAQLRDLGAAMAEQLQSGTGLE